VHFKTGQVEKVVPVGSATVLRLCVNSILCQMLGSAIA
jgi:hypothetical protein